MKRGVILALLAAFVFILIIGVVDATFSYNNNSIKTSYVLGEKVSGKFNISFSNQKIDSLFTSNFNGSARLKDFLDRNNLTEGEEFNCRKV